MIFQIFVESYSPGQRSDFAGYLRADSEQEALELAEHYFADSIKRPSGVVTDYFLVDLWDNEDGSPEPECEND